MDKMRRSAIASPINMRPTGASPGSWHGSESAHRSKTFAMTGLRISNRPARAIALASPASRSDDRYRRHQKRIEGARHACRASREALARGEHVEVVGSAHPSPAAEPRGDHRIVPVTMRLEQPPVPGVAFGDRQAAADVQREHLGELRHRDLDDQGAGR
jgi:hypothetical protein